MGNDVPEVKFQCSGCGCCCSRVGKAIANMKSLGFPYEAKEDGSCTMLDENKQCKVYDDRPEVCSVDRMYEKYYKEMFENKKDFYTMQSEICHKFINEDGMDSKYLVDLTQYK